MPELASSTDFPPLNSKVFKSWAMLSLTLVIVVVEGQDWNSEPLMPGYGLATLFSHCQLTGSRAGCRTNSPASFPGGRVCPPLRRGCLSREAAATLQSRTRPAGVSIPASRVEGRSSEELGLCFSSSTLVKAGALAARGRAPAE